MKVMKVMKFGGSSLADSDRIAVAANIVAQAAASQRVVVVVSAMRSVTDTLLELAHKSASGHDVAPEVRQLRDRHRAPIEALCAGDPVAMARIKALVSELTGILHGVSLALECTERVRALIVGFGELLSSVVMAAVLSAQGAPAEAIDARELIIVDGHDDTVDFAKTYENIGRRLLPTEQIAVVTGFIAARPDGSAATLGRNGSDYSASILGVGLHCELVEIWTDVDGVMSADPREVRDAFVLPQISFQEAMELSYFGAEIIHPRTMTPVIETGVPIRIRNTHNQAAVGTLISRQPSGRVITGIASIADVSLIDITGSGMVGRRGIAASLFTALADHGVNVVMISQASSEHSICLVCRSDEARRAIPALRDHFAAVISEGIIEAPRLVENLYIIAVIGGQMRGTPGISGKLFSALGTAGINVLAIAQGSSEMNISFVIEGRDHVRAMNLLHNTFFPALADGATAPQAAFGG